MRFLPAGRVQNAMGAARQTTAFNCFVSGTIDDSMDRSCNGQPKQLRPCGEVAASATTSAASVLVATSLSRLRAAAAALCRFMGIYDAICQTIASSGHRRGAQMGVLRIDHPDIERSSLRRRTRTN